MNRLSGNHGDNIRPVIYTTEKTKKDVLNGFAIHDEQVKALISISQKGNVLISSEYLETYPIFKNRHSTNYNKVKGIEKNLIENPNKTKEDKILEKPELDCINFYCKINDEYEEEKKKNIEMYGEGYYNERSESDDENITDENIVDGVNTIKLKKWCKNKNAIVGKILRFLYTENKQVSVDDIMNAIDYDGSSEQFFNNIKNGSGLNAQFGLLWNYSRNTVVINPHIYEIIKEKKYI